MIGTQNRTHLLSFTGLLLLLFLPHRVDSQPAKRIYIAPDDHTDFFWTAGEETYRQTFLDTLDFYLDLADTTQNEIPAHQSRWNCDGSFWMYTYQKNKTPVQFQRLIDRIKDGHISVPLNPLCVCWGATPLEAVLRGMYYSGRIERQYNLRFRLAYSIENQSHPYGLAALWAGAGARYSWKGICDCDTRVSSAGDREHDIYWHGGPDGSRILMKWNSLIDQDGTVASPNQSVGGYAEARNPSGVVDILDSNATFLARFPYTVAAAFGAGWDDLATLTNQFVTVAKAKTNASRTVIVSNEQDFFEDFEATHGDEIPTLNVSFGTEWELYLASLAEVSSRPKRAIEKLRTAEAAAALVSLNNPGFMQGREAARELAFMNLGLFYEHDFGMISPPSGLVSERIAWQRRIADEIDSYVDTLHQDALAELGAEIVLASPQGERFFAFNPLAWDRTDFADYPFSGAGPVHVVEVSTGSQVPAQTVIVDGNSFLRVWAEEVPSLGYKVFEICPGAGTGFSNAAMVNGSILENARYRIDVAENGAIDSLIDKSNGNRQFVRDILGRTMNDLGDSTGSVTVENAGPVSVTLLAEVDGPVPHRSRVTLFRGGDRIDIRNDIEQNFNSIQSWSFGFELDSPSVHHEEVGAVVLAKLDANGGHYSSRNMRYDYVTINHFADIVSGGVGMTLSNWDCYFMKLGTSTSSTLDTNTPRIQVLSGGKVANGANGLPSQGGDNRFLQRFALRTHQGYDQTAAMRFSLEHQNPLATGEVTGGNSLPPFHYSLVEIDNPDVLLWSLKPAEEGIAEGLVARLWNQSNAQEAVSLSFPERRVVAANRTSHLETVEGNAAVQGDGLTENLNPHQVKTFLLRTETLAEPSSGVNLWILY